MFWRGLLLISMPYPSNDQKSRGVTLIEALLYAALLSLLLASFIRFAYDLHIQDLGLSSDIQDAQLED
jgi:type II secretory pathway component PulJ